MTYLTVDLSQRRMLLDPYADDCSAAVRVERGFEIRFNFPDRVDEEVLWSAIMYFSAE